MSGAPFPLEEYLFSRRAKCERALEQWLPPESAPPSSLHSAVRYAVFSGGKRLRPILVLAACEAGGGDPDAALPFACAVECVHAYSLIHDDLPALDNDDLRRGRPTVHRVFGEATAILAGDALLTLAFDIALSAGALPAEPRLAALRILTGAIGTSGMIGGQVDDLLETGAVIHGRSPVRADRVRSIHERKTGALLRACALIGGVVAGASESALGLLGIYGSEVGLAFQIVDDILDVTGTAETLGKSAGKDAAAHKATFPAAIGVAASRDLAERLASSAEERARALGPGAAPLSALARYVVRRSS